MNKENKNQKSRILVPLCLGLGLLLSGCVQVAEPFDFYALERQEYTSENGYSIQFPADWQLLEEDRENVTFISGDGKLSCTISLELGGIEVYSMEEVGEMLAERMGEQLFSSYTLGEADVDSATYRQLVQGETDSGEQLTADLNIYHKQQAVRYYMSFLCESGDYAQQRPLINAIQDSFENTLDTDELYQLMMERMEADALAEYEAALEAYEQEQSALEQVTQGEESPGDDTPEDAAENSAGETPEQG